MKITLNIGQNYWLDFEKDGRTLEALVEYMGGFKFQEFDLEEWETEDDYDDLEVLEFQDHLELSNGEKIQYTNSIKDPDSKIITIFHQEDPDSKIGNVTDR